MYNKERSWSGKEVMQLWSYNRKSPPASSVLASRGSAIELSTQAPRAESDRDMSNAIGRLLTVDLTLKTLRVLAASG